MKFYSMDPKFGESLVGETTVRYPDQTESRIRTIEKHMREHRQSYNRDESMQSELRDLYSQREEQ